MKVYRFLAEKRFQNDGRLLNSKFVPRNFLCFFFLQYFAPKNLGRFWGSFHRVAYACYDLEV